MVEVDASASLRGDMTMIDGAVLTAAAMGQQGMDVASARENADKKDRNEEIDFVLVEMRGET